MGNDQVPYVNQALSMVGGRFFRVDFVKKSNGKVRKLIGRMGVKSHAKGTGKATSDPNIVTVWDTQAKQYRSFDKRNVLMIRSGIEYRFYEQKSHPALKG